MSREEVDEIVLVGGSTRVPRVKAQLRAFFGKDLNDHIDPDVTVAYGAASIMDWIRNQKYGPHSIMLWIINRLVKGVLDGSIITIWR